MFLLKSVFGHMRYHGKICLILILSIAAGFLCPIYVLGRIMFIYADIGRFVYENPENVLIAWNRRDVISSTGIEGLGRTLADYSYGFESLYQATLEYDSKVQVSTIGGLSDGILGISPYELVEGRVFSAEELASGAQDVCLIKNDLDIVRNGCGVGDEITILGKSLTVIGVIDTNRILASVLVPYSAIESFVGEDNEMQHRLVIRAENPWSEEAMESISALCSFRNGMVFDDMMTSVQEDELNDAALWNSMKKWLIVGVLVMLFALLSVWIITVAYTMDERYSYGIRRAVGAGRRRIFGEIFVQNIVIAIIALILDAAAIRWIVTRIMPFGIKYSGISVVLLGGGAVLVALLLSALTARMLGKNVHHLLGRTAYGH